MTPLQRVAMAMAQARYFSRTAFQRYRKLHLIDGFTEESVNTAWGSVTAEDIVSARTLFAELASITAAHLERSVRALVAAAVEQGLKGKQFAQANPDTVSRLRRLDMVLKELIRLDSVHCLLSPEQRNELCATLSAAASKLRLPALGSLNQSTVDRWRNQMKKKEP